MQNILRICITFDVDTFSKLFNNHWKLLLDKYLGKICVKWKTKVSTSRTYLNDLSGFSKYLIAAEVKFVL